MKAEPMVNETLLDIAMSHADKLILKAQSGDENAFNKLVSLWYKRIYNYGYKYAGSHDIAMDMAQNTFINVHKKLEQLRALEYGHRIMVRITEHDSPEVDLPEDIDRIESLIEN